MKRAKAKAKQVPRGAATATKSKKQAVPSSLLRRIERLEEAVDELRRRQFHRDERRKVPEKDLLLALVAQDRYIRVTADGWLLVVASGTRTPLPSGLKVSLTSSSGGRDYGTVLEGVLAGTTFDVSSGNLDVSYRRLESLKANVQQRPGGPVVIGGISYELELKIAFREGGTQKTVGPFAAKIHPANPIPTGTHEIEIADFPHEVGLPYGPHGTVWFRIGHLGDRYVHPGRISEGCLTCAPSQWEQIYSALHCARTNDKVSVGNLVVA